MKPYMSLFQYRGALVAKCPGANMAGHHRTVENGPVSMLQRVRAVLATRGETTLHRWFCCCSSVYVIKLGVDKVICRTITHSSDDNRTICVHVLLVLGKPCADHAISTGSGIINPPGILARLLATCWGFGVWPSNRKRFQSVLKFSNQLLLRIKRGEA